MAARCVPLANGRIGTYPPAGHAGELQFGSSGAPRTRVLLSRGLGDAASATAVSPDVGRDQGCDRFQISPPAFTLRQEETVAEGESAAGECRVDTLYLTSTGFVQRAGRLDCRKRCFSENSPLALSPTFPYRRPLRHGPG